MFYMSGIERKGQKEESRSQNINTQMTGSVDVITLSQVFGLSWLTLSSFSLRLLIGFCLCACVKSVFRNF
jgi:hypothetical protein